MVICLSNDGRAKGICFSNVGTCLEICSVNIFDNIGLCNAQQVVITLKGMTVICEALTSKIIFRKCMTLNHSAHRTIQNKNTFLNKRFYGFTRVFKYSHDLVRKLALPARLVDIAKGLNKAHHPLAKEYDNNECK